MRPSRDAVYMLMASALAARSTCVRRNVGCLLVSADGRVLSLGYNGVPKGHPHCYDVHCAGVRSGPGQGLDLCEAIHAEQNALIRCREPEAIHTCYSTASPCIHCVKMLLNTPCQRILFAEEYPHPESKKRWLEAHRTWLPLVI